MGFSLQKGIRGTWDNARGIINANLEKIEAAISGLPRAAHDPAAARGGARSTPTPIIDVTTTDQVHLDRPATNLLKVTVVGVVTDTDENDGWLIAFHITDDGTPRTLTWGSQFAATAIPLPTTTVANQRLIVEFVYQVETQLWYCKLATTAFPRP